MKCHYEILEVARDANADDIKKTYRKLALKWHPDKNPDNVEECTQYFALIQQAYEVLSDERERDFYDRHRESILKGGFDDGEVKESLDLFKYFSASCYKGYEDDKNGFYAVYRKVFNVLASEDYDEMDKYDEKKDDYPDFGTSNSDYDKEVAQFYGFWGSFSTARSFAWLDKYDIRQADNRWEARQIENENKKYRETGKQERNDQIRQLVAFVRKRDPRVKAYRELLEQKQKEAKKKQEENRKKQILENQKHFVEDQNAEAERIAHLIEVSMQMAEDYDSCSDEEGEDLPYCVVCNKSFKSANAKLNHENSKQHIKQLNELKKHMREEDSTLLDSSTSEKLADSNDKPGKASKKNRRKKGNGIFDYNEEDIVQVETLMSPKDEEPEIEEKPEEVKETVEETQKKEKKKRRADKKVANTETAEDEDAAEPKTGKCDRCKEVFDSRTKLFAHLKLTGHATLLVNNKKVDAKKKGGKKNRKNSDDW